MSQSLYLSVKVLRTALLIEDTKISKQILLKSQLAEGWSVGYLQSVEELNLEPRKRKSILC